MFWIIKPEIIDSKLGPYMAATIKPKKHFETMFTMLRDAEKYDNVEEKQVSDMMLRNLCEFIKTHETKSETK